MEENVKKKYLAFLPALTMLLSMVPAVAAAEAEPGVLVFAQADDGFSARSTTKQPSISMRLDAVSASTGFSGDNYLIRVFKAFTGLTPGEYRKHMKRVGEKNEDDSGV